MLVYRTAAVPANGSGVTTTEAIYVDREGKQVKEDDPNVYRQLYGAGSLVPFSEAEKYGLSKPDRDAIPAHLEVKQGEASSGATGLSYGPASTDSGQIAAIEATGDPNHTATTGMTAGQVAEAAKNPAPGVPAEIQTQAEAPTTAKKRNAAAAVSEG